MLTFLSAYVTKSSKTNAFFTGQLEESHMETFFFLLRCNPQGFLEMLKANVKERYLFNGQGD